MRSYVVIGLGTFGMAVARELSRHGCRVLALDRDRERADEAQTFADVALIADGCDRQTLAAVGVEGCDTGVVGIGSRDGATLATLQLTRLGVEHIVAKAADEDHGEILSRVGATRVVYPEKELAFRLAGRLGSSSVIDYFSVGHGLDILELATPAPFVGKPLSELALARKHGVQVLAVKELVPERVNLIPGPGYVLKDSDILLVTGAEEDLKQLRAM